MLISLKKTLSDPILNVMNFLNEITIDYPSAISFATGSPLERFFHVEESIKAIDRFIEYRMKEKNLSRAKAFDEIGQYNRTNGIINEIIANHLAIDEGIRVPPEAIMITCGAQEAMAVSMMALFDISKDVLLVSDPTYIGITGLAKILNVQVFPVPISLEGFRIHALQEAIEEIRATGKTPRAFYEIPDFNNPLGTSMPLSTRRELLELARENQLLIIEDNPYGMLSYDNERLPTLKALDQDGVVLYIGTFAKTLFPGLRIGYLVADQQPEGEDCFLAESLSKIKGFTTVNTPPLLQAMVGGSLLASNFSLIPTIQAKLPIYKENRDRMIARLTEEFGKDDLREIVHWNCPAGGFFLTIELPFNFDEKCFYRCAQDYGVLCCPISFFALTNRNHNQVRLSFSYVTTDQIDVGIRRLAQFVRDQVRELISQRSLI